MDFNFYLSCGALQRSTLRRVVNREEHAEVPEQLMRWVKVDGRVIKGLVRRRRGEVCLYQGF